MKFSTKTKDIVKAAKKAGITFSEAKGSHVKWSHPDASTPFYFASHGKDCSSGMAKKAWAYINGDFAKAY